MTAVPALLGEMGWWQVRDHMAMAKLNYAGRLKFAEVNMWCKLAWMEGLQKFQGHTSWWKEVFRVAVKYGVNLMEEAQSQNSWKAYVRKCMDASITQRWKNQVEEKSSLMYYSVKEELRAEKYHSGDWESILCARARCGQLDLKSKVYRWQGGDRSCPVCLADEEDLEHFMAVCPAYSKPRQVLLEQLEDIWGIEEMDRWRDEGNVMRIAWVLGFRGEVQERQWQAVKEFVREAWQTRMDVLEDKGVHIEMEDEDVPEDWAGYCKLV